MSLSWAGERNGEFRMMRIAMKFSLVAETTRAILPLYVRRTPVAPEEDQVRKRQDMFLMLNKNDYKARIWFGALGTTLRRGLRRNVAVCNGHVTSHPVDGPVCTGMRTKGAHLGYSTVG